MSGFRGEFLGVTGRYAADEIRFNLLAIVERKDDAATREVQNLKRKKGNLYTALQGIKKEAFEKSVYPDFDECVL